MEFNLGTMVTSRNEMEREILARITSGNRCFYSLQHLLKKRNISRSTKLIIYNTIIRPVVLYGCETWTLTKRQEQRLLVFENIILRRIMGPIYDRQEGVWRRRHNEELREISRQPLITNYIRAQRIRWAGHAARMEEGRMPRSVMEGNIEGRRPVGRPRMRWRNNLMRDLEELGMELPENNWRDAAHIRGTWRGLVQAAMGHQEAREPPE